MSKQANDIIRKLQRYKKSLGANDYRHIYETLTAQMSEAGVQVPNGNRSKQVVQQIGYSEGQMRQHEQLQGFEPSMRQSRCWATFTTRLSNFAKQQATSSL